LVLDPADLPGADVAILGARTDELVTNRPGARFGPRGIRNADYLWGSSRPAMDTGVDFLEVLTVVDHGDVEIIPGYAEPIHQGLREGVAGSGPRGRSPSSSGAITRSPIRTWARWPRA
jgi:arginase family enzyme